MGRKIRIPKLWKFKDRTFNQRIKPELDPNDNFLYQKQLTNSLCILRFFPVPLLQNGRKILENKICYLRGMSRKNFHVNMGVGFSRAKQSSEMVSFSSMVTSCWAKETFGFAADEKKIWSLTSRVTWALYLTLGYLTLQNEERLSI